VIEKQRGEEESTAFEWGRSACHDPIESYAADIIKVRAGFRRKSGVKKLR